MSKQEEKNLPGFLPEEQSVSQTEVEYTPEKEESVKTSAETPAEEKNEAKEKPKFKIPQLRKRPTHIPTFQDPQIQKIEKILEQGLGDSFSRLSPIAQQEFKIKGEQTAIKINELMKRTHIKIKKILKLIFDWLKLLPGVNKFFLEQEAKIKADKILSLKEHK
jgi:hypothetical protein